ncbi:sensor histidine kinase [Actinosynnema sp. NPDC047251]|uniref:histidine kinase n=1 Tax=Saccharothrix espanaensis (strain ATCC 51144 / DSM 44229 / JCM 9112 / NBRC 15066 / NRRL 15764) TaxID=1179773 RepID=K0K1M7_SACES|nr:sensor histidine kinase [Saccharothrix espanaensis]CCH30478.1 putative histidine kinase [Saccharothrix espanaensis DSM 44229]
MRSRFVRWLPTAYLFALDVVAGVAVTVTYLGFAEQRAATVPLWFGYALAVLIGLPLAVRRKWPLAVFGVVVVAQTVATTVHITLEPFVPTAFALYMVAAVVAHKRAVGALVCSLVLSAVSIFIGEPWPDDIGLAAFVVLLSGGAWALGRSTQVRRGYAERQAAEHAARAVVDERMRIARELHDVVAHSLSLIAVKAGIANHVAAEQPEQAQEALQVIETASRSTLVEMRRLLGVLRSDSDAELAPMPGLADLPGLLGRASMAGVPVELSVTGGQLPEAVGLTVFRIVQESVTNVVKHAAPARCAVVVEVGEAAVRISVTDDGPGERVLGSTGGGHGLIGMRERVAVYGGTFSAGPRGDGGFQVSAEVPFA